MENQFISNQETKNFFNTIKENFLSCMEFKICVSFIRVSGAQLLLDLLQDLELRGIKGQILTSTYMHVTQPDALEMLSSFKNIELKIYTTSIEKGFHAKGYLFLNKETNISGAAFKKNVEWNILNSEPLLENREPGIVSKSILEEFNTLWESPYAKRIFK